MSNERTPNAIDRRLGQHVRTRRIEIGMSQERLAELLGVTFQQVQKYEKGINRVSASRLYAIAAALNMPVAPFFEGMTPAGGKAVPPPSVQEDVRATPEGAELLALFASIRSVKVRRRAIALIRALTESSS